MYHASARRYVSLLAIMLAVLFMLTACGGENLETVPDSSVQSGQEGVTTDLTDTVESDTGVTGSTDVTSTMDVTSTTASTDSVGSATVGETSEVTASTVTASDTDTETVTVGAETSAESPGVTTNFTESATSIVTDTIVVTAVTNVVTDVTVIENVSTTVDVEVEESDIDLDTSEGVAVTGTETTTSTTITTGTAAAGRIDATGTATTTVSRIGIEGAQNVLVTATSSDGYNFDDPSGEGVGEVAGIVIDTETGQTAYLVVQYGGFLGAGARQIPMPLDAFTWVDEDTIAINYSQEELEQFPVLEGDWFEGDWNPDVAGFWNDIGIGGEIDLTDEQTAAQRFVLVENILGRQVGPIPVEADDAQNTGNAEELLLDLSQGIVKYVLVDVLDIEIDGMYAFPFTAFDWNSAEDPVPFRADFDTAGVREAPLFDRANIDDPANADPQNERDIFDFWRGRGLFADWPDEE